MAWRFNYSMDSIQGRRTNNEDAIAVHVEDDFLVAVVADGMGGQAAGEIASGLAVRLILEKVNQFASGSEIDEKERVRKILWEVNQEILHSGTQNMRQSSMGTTVVLLIRPKGADHFLVAHLGDSRAYECKDKNLTALTSDHTLTQYMVRQGIITPEQAIKHPYRNRLVKYLGAKDPQDGPDISLLPIKDGQKILLCSDGLLNGLSEKDILQSISSLPTEGLTSKLCQAALDGNSQDNISCVVLDVAQV